MTPPIKLSFRITTLFLSMLVLLLLSLRAEDVADPGAVPSSGTWEVAGIFSDHMVLQREMKVPVWGWAQPGEEITVTIDQQTKTGTANDKGKWRVDLDPLKTGDPRKMTIKGKSGSLEINDILVGEVWLCSGQSNMEWHLSRSADGGKAVAAANLPNIRLFNMARDGGATRVKDGKPAERMPVYDPKLKLSPEVWQVCSPETVPDFSAVAFYFGRDLQTDLKVPIGLISNPVGGTSIERWISRAAFEADPDYKAVVAYHDRQVDFSHTPEGKAEIMKRAEDYAAKQAELKAQGKSPLWPRQYNTDPKRDELTSIWFNTRVNPLIPFALRGVIWYQGEGNSWWPGHPDYPFDYEGMMALLIKDWRGHWAQGDFPFLFVQLPFWGRPEAEPINDVGWSIIREAQMRSLKIPHTGMAVTIDVGDPAAIHPLNKEPVGERLSLAARSVAYGENLVFSGPIYREMKIEGGKIRLSFDHVGGGLVAKGGGDLKRFAIAGAEMKFVWAQAVIEKDTVVVSSPEVPNPVAVRYAWETYPEGCNLFNKEGLPASPFRTDQPAKESRAASYKKILEKPPTFKAKA